MKFIKQNKEIFIQIVMFVLIGFFLKKYYFFIFSILLIIILPFNTLTQKYIFNLNRLLNLIGFWIKNLLFTLLYVFVFCPLALIRKKQNNKGFVIKKKTLVPIDFEKMW